MSPAPSLSYGTPSLSYALGHPGGPSGLGGGTPFNDVSAATIPAGATIAALTLSGSSSLTGVEVTYIVIADRRLDRVLCAALYDSNRAMHLIQFVAVATVPSAVMLENVETSIPRVMTAATLGQDVVAHTLPEASDEIHEIVPLYAEAHVIRRRQRRTPPFMTRSSTAPSSTSPATRNDCRAAMIRSCDSPAASAPHGRESRQTPSDETRLSYSPHARLSAHGIVAPQKSKYSPPCASLSTTPSRKASTSVDLVRSDRLAEPADRKCRAAEQAGGFRRIRGAAAAHGIETAHSVALTQRSNAAMDEQVFRAQYSGRGIGVASPIQMIMPSPPGFD